MWLAIKDLYTEVRGQVFYSSTLSRKFDISQGTGQGRILAPFMYKVYINSLLNELTNHCYAISINQLSLPSPSFADDIALLALYPTFLTSLMGMCYKYSTKWRYEFNHTKSGVVTYGETKPVHFEEIKEREWILGDVTVDELYEYKNLGVLKNYIGSFSSNVEDNMDKTWKMIFSSNFDRRRVNPFIYKFWSQACLPSLLHGSELFTLKSSLLAKLERCQQWFLKSIFYVPKFAPIRLILKLSGLNSIETEIALRKLLFLGRMITENKLTPTVRNLFRYQVDSFFYENISSLGILPCICETLHRYELFYYFESRFHNSTFPNYSSWKKIVKSKINKYEEQICVE